MLVGLRSSGALTIPELLLIFEVVRHLKCHVGVAGQLLNSSSPAMYAPRGCWQGASWLLVVTCSRPESQDRDVPKFRRHLRHWSILGVLLLPSPNLSVTQYDFRDGGFAKCLPPVVVLYCWHA